MKIERQPGLHTNVQQAVAPVANWNAAGAQRSFETAIRNQRQRVMSPQQRTDASPTKPRSASTAGPKERDAHSTRVAGERVAQSQNRPQSPVTTAAVDDSPTLAFVDRARSARWRRMLNSPDDACIEVVHPTTGSRFLLSRQDGIWLLAIQSRAAPIDDDDPYIQTLREQFAKRGLGPLDIVKL